jgi:hypothetical protein
MNELLQLPHIPADPLPSNAQSRSLMQIGHPLFHILISGADKVVVCGIRVLLFA